MKINIKVKPNSKKQEIKKIEQDYVISLKSKPENNKANVELIKLLNKKFGGSFSIIKGFKGRNKVVEVKNVN